MVGQVGTSSWLHIRWVDGAGGGRLEKMNGLGGLGESV